MNSKKNVLIAVLALTSIAGGVLAWQQHQRTLPATSSVSSSDHDALLKKLADAERRAADLESRLAALQAAGASSPRPVEVASKAPEPRRDRGDNGPDGNRRAERDALMNSPEVLKLMSAQQKAGLDGRYADLFKSLKLSPAQIDTLKNLLLEKENSRRDVMMAARESGLNPRQNPDEFGALLSQANAESDTAIVAAIGQQKFDEYKNYEATQPQRFAVNQLAKSLSYTATPLSDTQSAQLVTLLAQNKPTNASANGGGGFATTFNPGGPLGSGGMVGGGNSVSITDAIITQAQSFLTAPQVDALKQQQATQQAQQELQQLMRGANQNGRAANGRPSTTEVRVP